MLYHGLGLFTAANLDHMFEEETHDQAVLSGLWHANEQVHDGGTALKERR